MIKRARPTNDWSIELGTKTRRSTKLGIKMSIKLGIKIGHPNG